MQNADGSTGEFTPEDERLISMLCSHMSIILKHWGGEFSVPDA
jgi:hypothetical protein